MDPVEQIKKRLELADVIKEYLPLQKAGVNYKAPCPFHSEKTPSFFVSTQRQMWHCFGCGLGGDVFSFVQKIEGLEFPEALRLLALRAGVELTEYKAKTRTKRNNFLDVLDAAASFYQKILLDHPKAADVREYLQSRGLTEETIRQFRLGYAPPSWDSLTNYLSAQKFSLQDVMKVGLLSQNDRGGAYDRFRGRLMFPIRDVNGQTVGFGGRMFVEDAKVSAKYINSPQSDVYDKSTVLYGLHDARFAIKEANLAIVVEGYFDLIMSHQSGVLNSVAVSGTALTEQHVRLLKRYTDTIALCFDGDSAGARATERSFNVALQEGMQVLVITLPDGKDPADCVLENPEMWLLAVQNAQKYLDYVLDRAVGDLTSSDIARKKKGVAYVFSILKDVTSRMEQMHYVNKIADYVNIPETILWEDFARVLPTKTPRVPEKKSRIIPQEKSRGTARMVLTHRFMALLMYLFEERVHFSSVVVTEDFIKYLEPEYQKLYKTLCVSYNSERSVEDFKAEYLADSANHEQIRIISLIKDQEFVALTQKQVESEYQMCTERLRELYLKDRLFDIQQKLKAAEQQKDTAVIAQLLATYNELLGK